VITGHSLGAGCAVLVHLLLARHFPDCEIESFAFGGPPVLSTQLKLNSHQFVLRNDIIPTMSVWNVARFLTSLKRIDLLELSTWQRCKLIAGLEPVPADFPIQETLDMNQMQGVPPLVHVGDMYRIDRYDGEDAPFSVRKVAPGDVDKRISIAFRSCLLDHLPSRYEKALRECVVR